MMHPASTSEPCNLCGSTDRKIVGRIGRDLRPLTTVVCKGCGLMRQEPIPTDAALRDYYEKKYRISYKGNAEPRPRDLARDLKRAEERLDLLAPLLQRGASVLDFGSGSGMFLRTARERGYRVSGIEPDIHYGERLRKDFDLPVHVGPWHTAEFAPGSFDFVVMHHVLEHLRAPVAALQRIHEWTREGGHLYLGVPDMKNADASPINRTQPAHLYGFTPETLEMAALRAGFARVDLPGTHGTHVVFQRLAAAPADWRIHPDHGAEMVSFYEANTMAKYLLRPAAYTRFTRHLRRGLFQR